MFIIPCKFDKQKPIIYECLNNLRKYHDEPVVIIDSDSSDTTYGAELKNSFKDVFFETLNNRNYEIGALKIAFQKYDFSDFFLIHDSMFINKNISHIKSNSVVSVRYFNSWDGVGGVNMFSNFNQTYRYGYDNEEQKNIVHKWNNLKHKIPYVFNGVFGSSFYAKKEIIQQLSNEGLFDCLPTSKLESQAMERYLGILFNKLNIDHFSNSLMGEHHTVSFSSNYITKIIMGRQ